MYNIKDFWKFNKDGASEFEIKKNILNNFFFRFFSCTIFTVTTGISHDSKHKIEFKVFLFF